MDRCFWILQESRSNDKDMLHQVPYLLYSMYSTIIIRLALDFSCNLSPYSTCQTPLMQGPWVLALPKVK